MPEGGGGRGGGGGGGGWGRVCLELTEPLELDAPRYLVQTWPDGPEISLNQQKRSQSLI